MLKKYLALLCLPIIALSCIVFAQAPASPPNPKEKISSVMENITTLPAPFGFKLAPLGEEENIQRDDLIWFPDHLLVVEDATKNLVLKAEGFPQIKGEARKAHHIQEIFSNIKTLDQLKTAYLTQPQPLLTFLDPETKILAEVRDYTILNMDSAFTEYYND